MRNLDSCRCWRCMLCPCKVRNKILFNFWNRTIFCVYPVYYFFFVSISSTFFFKFIYSSLCIFKWVFFTWSCGMLPTNQRANWGQRLALKCASTSFNLFIHSYVTHNPGLSNRHLQLSLGLRLRWRFPVAVEDLDLGQGQGAWNELIWLRRETGGDLFLVSIKCENFPE